MMTHIVEIWVPQRTWPLRAPAYMIAPAQRTDGARECPARPLMCVAAGAAGLGWPDL